MNRSSNFKRLFAEGWQIVHETGTAVVDLQHPRGGKLSLLEAKHGMGLTPTDSWEVASIVAELLRKEFTATDSTSCPNCEGVRTVGFSPRKCADCGTEIPEAIPDPPFWQACGVCGKPIQTKEEAVAISIGPVNAPGQHVRGYIHVGGGACLTRI